VSRPNIYKHLPLLLLNLSFGLISLLWLLTIPYNHAPDEYAHFEFNVLFMVENGRLPVSGIDDARATEIGIGTYVPFPAINYVIAAAIASPLNSLFKLPLYLGGRLASWLFGLLFVNLLFFGVNRILRDPLYSAILCVCFSHLPQVIFISSYINQDVHALAISALLGLSVVWLYQKKGRKADILFFFAFGLLFSAKYNYFVYALVLPLVALHLVISGRYRTSELLTTAGFGVLGALSLSGFWFVRNYSLYGEVLGVKMAVKSNRFLRPQPVNLVGLKSLYDRGMLNWSFKSFIGIFDYLNLHLPWIWYKICAVFLGSSLVLFFVRIWKQRNSQLWMATGGVALVSALLWTQHTISCLTLDFQPQGRYHFPILVPAALLLALASRTDPWIRNLTRTAAGAVMILLLRCTWLIYHAYPHG